MRQALEASGYAVVVAGSGEEGLRKAAQRLPSAIIVDGHLPGMDGATVIRHARLDAALRNVPCVLLTGSQEQGAELVALDAGADAFVRKEDEIEVILARVAAVLRRAPIALLGESTASLLGPKRILAVDDSATYLHELASTLQGEGYDVVLARSGEEALELLAVQSVDCILLDLVMPGLSGQETCRRIKAAPVVRDLPIIMLTAVEDRAAMIDGLSAGADDYISKSSEFEVLRARVRAQIRRKQFEDENRGIREELLRREIEARAARELAETRAALVDELKRKNMELDSFTYSVSHDLRAPLRRIDGFSQMVLEDYSAGLDPKAREYLESVHAGVRRMTDLIDDLLKLSRIGRAELNLTQVDMTALARAVALELETGHPDRPVRFTATEGLSAQADPGLMRIVLENLLGNAWKFTRSTARPEVQFDADGATSRTTYFVRDNGVGFDMAYVEKLFAPFQRLHAEHEFPGTGIGLATVQRIVDRHSGRIWAESVKGEGTTIFWTIGTRKGLKGGGSLLTVPGQDPRAKSY
jgi:DNA-binding response OmpR family regulator